MARALLVLVLLLGVPGCAGWLQAAQACGKAVVALSGGETREVEVCVDVDQAGNPTKFTVKVTE